MKELKITTNVRVYQYDELVEEDKILVDKAKAMTENSYAPYSKFHVGAAVLLSNGKIVGGSNQENAAFPSGTCAERTTVYYAHSKYPEAKFEKLAIAAKKTESLRAAQCRPAALAASLSLSMRPSASNRLRFISTAMTAFML